MADDKKSEGGDNVFDAILGGIGHVINEILYILKIVIKKAWQLLLFVIISIIFIPSFLIHTSLNKEWNRLMGELFGL